MGTMCVIDPLGERREITGRRQRSLLALLVANKTSWTSALALTDELWPEDHDGAGAEGRLHVLVHRLRTRVGRSTIEQSEHGYRIAPSVEVDVWTFERAMDRWLRERVALAQTGLTLPRLEDVLAQWGGTPYLGLDQQRLVHEADRLVGVYLSGQETRFQHLLDLGDHAAVLRDAAPLARDHPLRERLLVVWMTALMRTGGRAEALRLYRQFAHRLESELGVVPGREIDELRRMAELTDWSEADGVAPVEGSTPTSVDGRLAGEQRAIAERWATAGRLSDALRLLGQVEVHCRVNDLGAEHAQLLRSMAVVSCQVGDLRRGLRLVREAQDITDSPGVAEQVRASEALILTYLHRDDEAADVLAHRDPNELTPPAALLWWRATAQVRRHRGDHERAVAAARRASALAEGTPPIHRGLVAVDLGTALRDANDPACFDAYRSALEVAYTRRARPLAALAHASVAKAWLQLDEPARSNVHSREALQVAQTCGAWGIAGRAALRLAESLDLQREPVRAAWYRTEGLSHLRRVDYPLEPAERARIDALVAAAESAGSPG